MEIETGLTQRERGGACNVGGIIQNKGGLPRIMKIAIFGDIHANLEALEAVMEDADGQGCTQFACIGDIVGYNANPRECLALVRELDCPVVKGNHDEEASSDTDITGLNPLARSALEWTREALDEEDKSWLRELRMLRQVRDFTIVHATLDSPSNWAYVMNKFDAMASFSYQFTRLCFFGHTHAPRIYIKDSRVSTHDDLSCQFDSLHKYFINVGSVGQPRDGDWRSSYAVFDADAGRVDIRRIEYDLPAAQKKILAEGLPERLAERLAYGR